MDVNGVPVFAGGENTIAVYEIDPDSGAPTLIQHVETHGFHPRTFHIDRSGTTLVVAHILGLNVREGSSVKAVPTSLSVFTIGADGRLHFERTHAIETNGATMFWMGIPWS